jgi:hypothetical protein
MPDGAPGILQSRTIIFIFIMQTSKVKNTIVVYYNGIKRKKYLPKPKYNY